MQTIINSDTIEVKLDGVSQVATFLKSLDPKIRGQLKSAFRNVGFLVQREGRRRAPYKEGNLERSIEFQAEETQVKIYVPVNSPAGHYAKIKHDGTYRLGPGTRSKGPQAGPKYLTRAVSENEAKINSLLKSALDTI
jgi:hypothetical protein